MKSNKSYWLVQILGWLAYTTLIMLVLYVESPEKINYKTYINLVSIFFILVFCTNLMRMIYIRFKWLTIKKINLIPRIIAVSIASSILITILSTISSIAVSEEELNKLTVLSIISYFISILILVFFWNAIYFTYHFFQKSKQQEIDNVSLEASKNEIELKNLRSQLNPHFLFNSLNSIRAMIEENPEKAKNAVTQLSNLLRKSLLLGKENLVSLKEELEMVENYLALEKIRFEERLNVEWKIEDSSKSFLVPPFIVQMLVENAIKHGISNLLLGGTIVIETLFDDQAVTIRVINSGQIKNEVDLGIGMKNTVRRLDLQYVNKVSFDLKQVENNVVAEIIFNKK